MRSVPGAIATGSIQLRLLQSLTRSLSLPVLTSDAAVGLAR